MKDAIIVALILAAVLLGFGQSREPEAQIQDTTLFHHAQAVPDNASPVIQRCHPVALGNRPMAFVGSEQEPVT